MPNSYKLKRRLIFLLKPVTKVFLGIYIYTITYNQLSLDYIKFGSVFKPSLNHFYKGTVLFF
jgi:hypothetical protein